jgi:uncharacterized membrane protein
MSEQTSASSEKSLRTADGVTRRALLAAGVFGFGFSGLIDVLVLHLVLQWHHLVSGLYPQTTMSGLRTNIAADGLFSLGMLVIMCVGAGLLWQSERRTDVPLALRPVAGAAVVGLGAFDTYDVVVDHMLLGLHQPVSQGGVYNPHWLAVSLLTVGAGYYIYRTGVKRQTDETAEAA